MSNQQHTSSWKSITAIIVIFVVFAIGYFYYSGGTPSPVSGSLLQTQVSPEANAASARILSLLNQIRTLKIDTSIFKDPAYMTLTDYSVAIPAVPVGRPNPFAPIPGVSETPTGGATR